MQTYSLPMTCSTPFWSRCNGLDTVSQNPAFSAGFSWMNLKEPECRKVAMLRAQIQTFWFAKLLRNSKLRLTVDRDIREPSCGQKTPEGRGCSQPYRTLVRGT